MSEACWVEKTSVFGRKSAEVGFDDVGRLATSLRYNIKWLQAITFMENMALLVWSG